MNGGDEAFGFLCTVMHSINTVMHSINTVIHNNSTVMQAIAMMHAMAQ